MIKNNVTRLLDAHHVVYIAYELPAEKLGAHETARLLDIPVEQIWKTIVVLRENPRAKPVLAVLPGSLEVDLKLLAKALGEKKLALPTEREAEQLTGLQAGGISPLALLQRGFQIVIEETCQLFDEIHISGGQRGLNIRLPVHDLIQLTNAHLADFGR